MMKNKISDTEVLQLLTNLKNAQNNYPQDMIESRRDAFAQQAAAMVVLMKAGGASATVTGTGQAASTATTSSSTAAAGIGGVSMGTILETALVIAIVAEAGVATYVYREKIAEFFKSNFGTKVEQVANPTDGSPSSVPSSENLGAIPTVTTTATPTPTVTFIPVPTNNNGNNVDGVVGVTAEPDQETSTPEPDDNGLHLGQTKQPTKTDNNSNQKDKDK